MQWKYIKWVMKQPDAKIVHSNYRCNGNRWIDLDTIKVFIGKKLMYKKYKDQSGIRFNWIERL